VQSLFTNAAPGEGDDRFTAFETTFSKSHTNGWSLLASYQIDKRDVKNIAPRNPNEARYNWELPETYQGVRLSGTVNLPWKVLASSTFTAQAGRYDWVKLSDLRLSKSIEVRRGHSIEAMSDVFNLTNSSVVLRPMGRTTISRCPPAASTPPRPTRFPRLAYSASAAAIASRGNESTDEPHPPRSCLHAGGPWPGVCHVVGHRR